MGRLERSLPHQGLGANLKCDCPDMIPRIVLVLLLLCPSLARAHAILLASDPPDGSSLTNDYLLIALRYSTRIDQGRSRLTLSRPTSQLGGGAEERLALLPSNRPDLIQARAESLLPGSYVLHWFVLAGDGHITRGDLRFTVVDE